MRCCWCSYGPEQLAQIDDAGERDKQPADDDEQGVPASILPTPQRTISRIWTLIYSAIIRVLPPPRMAGVTKKPREKMNTRILAPTTPGIDNGRNTWRNATARLAPRPRAAATHR
ncbi:hypothetical protein ACVWZ3_004844 [Bradyrhizobium sp. i1.3.6]